MNMIHSYVTLVTITMVTGFPSLLRDLLRSGTMATKYVRFFFGMLLTTLLHIWESSS